VLESKPQDWSSRGFAKEILKSKDYAELFSLSLVYERPLMEILRKYLTLPHVNLVGDIGCGDAAWLVFLAQIFPCKRFVGLDFEDTAIHIASRRKMPNLNIIKSDARRLPFRKEQFDFFMSLGVIEHFPNHVRILRNWLDFLRVGGFLLISAPNARRFDRFLVDYFDHKLSQMYRGKIKDNGFCWIRKGRILTSFRGYEERWNSGDFDVLAGSLKLDMVEKFGFQAFIPIPGVLSNALPSFLKAQYYRLFSHMKTNEKNGLVIGAVYTRSK